MKKLRILGKIFIVIFCIEATLQTVSYVRYHNSLVTFSNINFLSWYYKNNQNGWWIKEMGNIKPTYNPFLGYRFVNVNTPNIHIDTNGVRETKNSPPGNKQMLFFGGSTMAGWSVKDGETIPSYVAGNMNSMHLPYTLMNFGQIAYNSNQEIFLLQLQLKRGVTPDTVIFYDGCNETWISSRNIYDNENRIMYEKTIIDQLGDVRLNVPPENTTLINKNLAAHGITSLFTYIKILHYPTVLIQKIFRLSPDIKRDDPPSFERVTERGIQVADNYLNNMRIVEALSREYDFNYIFVWQPMRFSKHLTRDEAESYSSKSYWVDETIFKTATKRINDVHPKNFIDLSNLLAAYPEKSFFFDYCHVTPEANALVASAISQSILERKK